VTESELVFAEGNADQVEVWNGVGGDRWVAEQVRYDRMLEPFGRAVLDAADVGRDLQVLDVGCGCGATTLDAARAAASGTARGVDLSAQMLQLARDRAAAEDIANATFEQCDAQTHPFGQERFDRVISRFGVMFFADPAAAFANLVSTLRPGGRLVFAAWQPLARNAFMTVPAAAAMAHVPPLDPPEPGAPGPFSLEDPDHVRRLLTGAGLHDVELTGVDVPVVLGGFGGLDEALTFFRNDGLGRRLFEGVDAVTEAKAMDAVADALAPHATTRGIELQGSAWVVTATR
jgi:SAM-dependent methyltransferase